MRPLHFRQALLDEVSRVTRGEMPPPVARVFMPEPHPDPAREPEFGVVKLDDGSAGLYYAWLGDSQRGMGARFPAASLQGLPAGELARYFLREDEAARSLGLAAINAITAWWWRQQGYMPPPARAAFGVAIATGDRVGFIGYFQSLVAQLLAEGHDVVVLERKSHLWRRAERLLVTGDPTALADRDVVVGTATMCLNDSLDATLDHCRDAREIAIVGPTAGFLPGPLFARGVASVGGVVLTDADAAIDAMASGGPWKPHARHFLIEPRVCREEAQASRRRGGPPGNR